MSGTWLHFAKTDGTSSIPRVVASGPVAFREYVQASGAEFSVAQGIYVETQSGWFSDRTVRYLASGKPVLVQDTGFSRNYPVGEGLVAFRTMDEAVAGAERIARRLCAAWPRRPRDRRGLFRFGSSLAEDARGDWSYELNTGMSRLAQRTRENVRSHAGSADHPLERNDRRRSRTGRGDLGGASVSAWVATAGTPGGLRREHSRYIISSEGSSSGSHTQRGLLLPGHEGVRFRSASALLVAGTRQTVGLSYEQLRRVARSADVLINISGMLMDEELIGSIPRRVYLDLDPAFNQLWHIVAGMRHAVPWPHALRDHRPGDRSDRHAPVPTCGLPWITTRQPIVLACWPVAQQITHDA